MKLQSVKAIATDGRVLGTTMVYREAIRQTCVLKIKEWGILKEFRTPNALDIHPTIEEMDVFPGQEFIFHYHTEEL